MGKGFSGNVVIPIRKVGRRTNAKVNPALRLTVRDNPLALMGLRRAVIG